MTLVIMAAGMGSRFGGLKQIEPINDNGEFIIDYSVYDAIKTGFKKVVFIIKQENYNIFKETIGKRIEKQIEVEYVFQDLNDLPEGFNCPSERVKPWGTAHAILCAKNAVDEDFVVINSDDFYGRESYETVSEFLKSTKNNDKMNGAMVGYKLINTVTENGSVKRGVCKEENGKLVELIESKIENENGKYIAYPLEDESSFEVNSEALVSMNMFAFPKEIFKYLEEGFKQFLEKNKDSLTAEYLIPSVVFDLIKNNKLDMDVLKTEARWLGVTYKEDKDFVVKEIKKLHDKNIYGKSLW